MTVSRDAKRDRSAEHRHHIKEDRKGTSNNTERYGAIRITNFLSVADFHDLSSCHVFIIFNVFFVFFV